MRCRGFCTRVPICDSDAIYGACGEPRRTRRADIERVEIGAFAAQIPRLQHEPDVADTAAARFRVSKRVINDPVINRARLIKVGLMAPRVISVAVALTMPTVGR